MKLRRIFAALAACAIAATSVISASAADALLTVTSESDGSTVVVKGDSSVTKDNGKYEFLKGDYDLEKIDKIVMTFEATNCDSLSARIGANTVTAGGWEDKVINLKPTDTTAEWAGIGGLTASDEGVCKFGFDWVGPTNAVWPSEGVCTSSDKAVVKVTSVKLYDKDGNELVAKTAGGAAGGSNPTDPSKSNPKTGASAGLALAGLALAGVAVVATKKSK